MTAASKYFAASLGPNFQEGHYREFVSDDADFETLKAIVDYCYTGHIRLTEENVKTYLTIASSVELDLLEETCCSFYAEILTEANCVDAFVFADQFNFVKLRDAAMDSISEKLEFVPTTEIQKLDHRFTASYIEMR